MWVLYFWTSICYLRTAIDHENWSVRKQNFGWGELPYSLELVFLPPVFPIHWAPSPPSPSLPPSLLVYLLLWASFPLCISFSSFHTPVMYLLWKILGQLFYSNLVGCVGAAWLIVGATESENVRSRLGSLTMHYHNLILKELQGRTQWCRWFP